MILSVAPPKAALVYEPFHRVEGELGGTLRLVDESVHQLFDVDAIAVARHGGDPYENLQIDIQDHELHSNTSCASAFHNFLKKSMGRAVAEREK